MKDPKDFVMMGDIHQLEEGYYDEDVPFCVWYARQTGIPHTEMEFSEEREDEYNAWRDALADACIKHAGKTLFWMPIHGNVRECFSIPRVDDEDKRKLFSIPVKELEKYAAILVADILGYPDRDEDGKPCRCVDYDENYNLICVYPPKAPLDLCEVRETPGGYRYLAFGNRYIRRGGARTIAKCAIKPPVVPGAVTEDRARTEHWIDTFISEDMVDPRFWEKHQDWIDEL